MGVDIHVHLARKSRVDNLFHEVVLYRDFNGKFEKIPVYSGRNYELFDLLKNEIPTETIYLNDLEENFRTYIKNDMDEEGFYGFNEINLADLNIYLLKNPSVVDYDDENAWERYDQGIAPKPKKPSPVIDFYDTICNYLSLADESYEFIGKSNFKVIYYFDH